MNFQLELRISVPYFFFTGQYEVPGWLGSSGPMNVSFINLDVDAKIFFGVSKEAVLQAVDVEVTKIH